jgi:diguanylate cyclase (GGDEF)-like protein
MNNNEIGPALLRPAQRLLASLSIRDAVLVAIVLGVVLPALGLLLIDEQVARRSYEPLIRSNQEAVMQLGASGLVDPLRSVNSGALRQTTDGLLRENNVCGVEVIDLRLGPQSLGTTVHRCTHDVPQELREVAIMAHGDQIGRLRIWFDNREIERLLGERRYTVLGLVAAQVVAGIAVLLIVVSMRLLRPIALLKDQANAIAARTPTPELAWQRNDELGQLSQHLDEVRKRIDGLFDELEHKNAELRKMAMYDHLTGLPNRTLFRELFTHEAALAKRGRRMMAMLFIDLDRFKQINDSLGHAVGDELLVGISKRMTQALRQSDLVCRHSGDEFLVLLYDAEPWDMVAATAERLARTIALPMPVQEGAQEVQVSASIGISLYPTDGEDFDTLVRHADLAMYKSKQHGRARCSFFLAEFNEALRLRMELGRELGHAIEHGDLVLHYQPVVNALTGQMHGCEALVRWQHQTRGLLMPDSFISLAEESNLIDALGRWTLQAACAQFARWKAAGHEPGRIAVNVSALQFRDEGLIKSVQKTLQLNGMSPGELEIELTESTLMIDTDATQKMMVELRELGVALVVDDFGTGYSSLSYLKRLHPDKVKIDRSFVRDLEAVGDDMALVQAIIRLGQALDFKVVAEGIETVVQRELLLANGCHLLQGYRFARPMPADEFEHWLKESRRPTAASSEVVS